MLRQVRVFLIKFNSKIEIRAWVYLIKKCRKFSLFLPRSWLAIIAAIELSKAFGFALRRNRFPWFFVYLAIWIVCMFNNGDILVKFAAKAAEKNPLW